GIRERHLLDCLSPEENVELRVSEVERLVPVDQRDFDLTGERFGETRRQLETAEARAQDQNLGRHAASSEPRISTPSSIRSGVSKLKASRAADCPPAPPGKKSAPLTKVTPASVERCSRSAASMPDGRSTQRK